MRLSAMVGPGNGGSNFDINCVVTLLIQGYLFIAHISGMDAMAR